MQDIIEREVTVTASPEKVYQAITDPKQITTWFPDKIEGSLEVGQRPVFIFTEYDHKAQIYVEAATPFEYFAYRWVPGGAFTGDVLTVPNTLVEFFITKTDDGTKVTLKESGFAKLPKEMAKERHSQNSGGWDHMMGRLEKVMNQS